MIYLTCQNFTQIHITRLNQIFTLNNNNNKERKLMKILKQQQLERTASRNKFNNLTEKKLFSRYTIFFNYLYHVTRSHPSFPMIYKSLQLASVLYHKYSHYASIVT